MECKYRIIAIDFDGTIYRDEKISADCIEAIRALRKDGWNLILWTCRAGNRLANAKNILNQYGLLEMFDAFNENLPGMELKFKTSSKIIATIYIDDKIAGGFPGWSSILKTMKEQ